jgi:hypothetical protein
MRMIRRCRCSRSSRPSPVASGPTSATTARLAARIRRRRCSTTHETALAIIPASISPVTPASCRPMRSLDSMVSMTPSGGPHRSPKRRAGAMAAGTSSISQHCRSLRSLPKRCGGSTSCSRSSGASTEKHPLTGLPSARSGRSRWSMISRSGCASNVTAWRRATISPRPSITSSAAGSPSPASSTTAGSAYQTMLRNEQSAALPWAGETGPSQVRTMARLTAHQTISL